MTCLSRQTEDEATQYLREHVQRTHGITDEQYQRVIAAEKALLVESPYEELCAWCGCRVCAHRLQARA